MAALDASVEVEVDLWGVEREISAETRTAFVEAHSFKADWAVRKCRRLLALAYTPSLDLSGIVAAFPLPAKRLRKTGVS